MIAFRNVVFIIFCRTLERIHGEMKARIQSEGLSPLDGAACSLFRFRWLGIAWICVTKVDSNSDGFAPRPGSREITRTAWELIVAVFPF